MTANPAQFLIHGQGTAQNCRHRENCRTQGTERTAEEHLSPSARTHHKKKLRMREQQEKQTLRVEDKVQQVKVLVALTKAQYSVSSIHIRLLTSYNSSSRDPTPFSSLHGPYTHIHTHTR